LRHRGEKIAREEAAPTFDTWRRRLEAAPRRDGEEVAHFLEVLRTIGSPMIDGPAVSFVYHDPPGAACCGDGRVQPMGPYGSTRDDGTDRRQRDLPLHPESSEPARLEYKPIVDEEWKPDPLCLSVVDNGLGGQNSYFVVGEFHDPPELEWVENIRHGHVEEFEFESQRLRNKSGSCLPTARLR
jgi:hypothetical protein